MKNRPAYAIESVDRALRLATLLQQEGSIGVTEAAETLGISVSGAHRLFAMLVYRDFAEQLPDRTYGPGSVLRAARAADAPLALLRTLGPPRLRELTERTGESSNLFVRVGAETRFVTTVESDRALRVGDRSGTSLPAHLTSAGRAILATLSAAELAEVYAEVADVDPRALHRRLARVRADGYAVNRNATEDGVTAVGAAVPGPHGTPVCGISVGLPSSRFTPALLPDLATAVLETAADLADDLAAGLA